MNINLQTRSKVPVGCLPQCIRGWIFSLQTKLKPVQVSYQHFSTNKLFDKFIYLSNIFLGFLWLNIAFLWHNDTFAIISNPVSSDRCMDNKCNAKVALNVSSARYPDAAQHFPIWFEFRVSLFLDCLPNKTTGPCLSRYLTYRWGEKNCIHTFYEDIST